MAELDENLDLLDLDDDSDIDALQPNDPFAASVRPRRPWMLFGAALIVIALATYIIVRAVGTDGGSSITIDLGSPAEIVIDAPDDAIVVPEPKPEAKKAEKPVPAEEKSAPVAAVPTREIEDRKEVKFNPSAKTTTSAAKPAAAAPKTAVQSGAWYVQFGSYASRSAAESAQRKIAAQHSNLFADKQFVILAAVLPNGQTTHRLRVAFGSGADANGFCRNAKSDGLECYVAK
jgi:hypothetical protein